MHNSPFRGHRNVLSAGHRESLRQAEHLFQSLLRRYFGKES